LFNQIALFSLTSPLPGAYGFRHSNPSVFCVMALHSSLQVFSEAGGVAALNQRSRLLTNFLEFLIEDRLKEKVSEVAFDCIGLFLYCNLFM
jgi:kynureninase